MVKIALDPTPFHATHGLLDFPDVTARLGFEYLQLTPHPDFTPFFRYPRADDDLAARLKKAAADAGVAITSLLPVKRISWLDELQRQAAVRSYLRIIQLAVMLEVPVINTEFSGRLSAVYAADTFDHRSHNLPYITNPPGTPARVHQHLKIGDVDWPQRFAALRSTGFLGREDALIVSNVFAGDDTADETSRYQLRKSAELRPPL